LPIDVLNKTLANCFKWLRPGGTMIIHTFPTKYWYMLLSRIYSLFLLPTFFFTKSFTCSYVKFLDESIIEFLSKIFKGQTHSQQVMQTGHCNPPHPFNFRDILKNNGFEVVKYELLDEVLSGIKGDSPRYWWGNFIAKKNEIFRSSIIAILRKNI